MTSNKSFALALLILIPICNGKNETKNFEELYKVGKDSYLANDWKNCVKYLEEAIADHKHYQQAITNCKIECRREMNEV